MILILLACSLNMDVKVDGDPDPTDTAPVPTDTATTPPCVLNDADPDSLTWIAALSVPPTTETVILTGCADPLVITCPPWIIVVSAPETVDGTGIVDLTIDPAGWSVDVEDVCTFNEMSVAVAMDVL